MFLALGAWPALVRTSSQKHPGDWKAIKEDTGYRGFVTRFEVDAAYASQFERNVVGGRQHEELWVPAENLEEVNAHILGPIPVVATCAGGPDAAPVEIQPDDSIHGA